MVKRASCITCPLHLLHEGIFTYLTCSTSLRRQVLSKESFVVMMIVPLAQESAGLDQLFQQGYAIVGVSDEICTGPAGIMRDWIGER